MTIKRLREEVIRCVGTPITELVRPDGIVRWDCDAQLVTTSHVVWFPNLYELVGFDEFGAELWVVQGDRIA